MSGPQSLAAWDVDTVRLDEMRDRLRERAGYSAAVQCLAANLVRDADEDAVLNAMLRDAGHNVAALSAVYLHAHGEGSLQRLKTFISGFGLVSPGRARSLLGYMLHLNYLEPDDAAAAGRRALYRVTPSFLASYLRHEASLLAAVAVVEPGVSLLQRHLSAPGILEALVIEQGDAFVAGSTQTRPFAAFYGVFLHRLAGIQILHDLVARAPAFPPTGVIAFSVRETARRFKVSRIHASRILEDARAQGFFVLEPGTLRFTEVGLEALDWLYASRLCLTLACAARVLKANPRLSPPTAA